MPTSVRLWISLALPVLALAVPACLDPYGDTAGTETGTGTGDTSSTGPGPSTTDDPTTGVPVTTADPVCGDGFVDPAEQCDLGPANADDGDCTSACRYAACGDGLVNPAAEQCDLGPDNADDGDCTSACKLPFCGDGLVQASEVCDDGDNDGAHGGCKADCSGLAPGCGDGLVDPQFEECDGEPGCLSSCQFARSCLDYKLDDPRAASGLYSVRRDGIADPIDVWCEQDDAVDGGGYTFLKVDLAVDMNVDPAYADGAEDTCAGYGMQLFVPRSPAHALAAHAFAVADNLLPVGGGSQASGADYLQILGIYPTSPGVSCVDQPLNDVACPEWQASDMLAYWVSDAAVGVGEPDLIGACADCSMIYQWNADGSVKSYKAVPEPGGYSYRFLCDTGDKLP